MVNNYSKMRRSNKKVKRWLEENGYKNIHFFPHTRWSKDLTLDELKFDGLCSINNELCLFQVKSNSKISMALLDEYRIKSKQYNIRCMWFNVINKIGIEVQC